MPPGHLCQQPAAEPCAACCEQGGPGLARGIHILGVLEAWCPVQHGSSYEGVDKEAGCDVQGGSALGEGVKSLSLHWVAT